MIEKDTIRLLRECSAGIKMGVSSIEEVLPKVKSEKLSKMLHQCKVKHEELEQKTHDLLVEYGDEEKQPNPIAKGMSWIKTAVKLNMDESDQTIADLITEGCDMGKRSLNKYLNEYEAAQEKAKDIAKKLIAIEDDLVIELQEFL